jgi:chromosome segregation ATPase
MSSKIDETLVFGTPVELLPPMHERFSDSVRHKSPREQELEAACAAALKELKERTNNFREAHQKLEAQNKALWELVEDVEKVLSDAFLHIQPDYKEMRAEIKEARAAIQKAKEAR